MITLFITLGSIVFTIFCFFSGYKIAMIRWNPKQTTDKLDKLNKINLELSNSVRILDETIKLKDNWYMQQLNNIAEYMDKKHDDDYVYQKLKQIPGYKKPITIETEKLKVDDILDKVSKFGWDSLTSAEREYLNKPDE